MSDYDHHRCTPQGRALGKSLATMATRGLAVLPATAKGRELLAGWQAESSPVYAGEFVGTGVSVVIVKLWRTGEGQ